MRRKKKTPAEVEPYWSDFVQIWFKFCRDRFSDSPVFDGSAPRDLKGIIKALKKRAALKKQEWTHDVATHSFYSFLSFAYTDPWLRKNWLLFNLNRQKEKLFFNLRKSVSINPTDPFE